MAQPTISGSARPSLHRWITLGLGPAGYYRNGNTTAFRAAANLSFGRAAALLRASLTGDGIDGYEEASERSLLAGIRLGGRRFYMIPAAGFGSSHWHDGYPCSISFQCTAAEEAQYDSKGYGFASDVGLHASLKWVGLALNYSAISGDRRSLSAIVFSVELGKLRK